MPDYIKKPKRKQTVEAIWRLEKLILDTLDFEDVVQRTVDGILHELGFLKLGYRIVVLALVNENKKVLERIAISQTKEAMEAVEESPLPFPSIDVPLSANNNLCIKVLKGHKFSYTESWPDILCPPFTSEKASEIQKTVGIKTSFICPVRAKQKTIGVMIFSLVKEFSEISADEKELILNFTDIVGLAVQNARLYSSVEETYKRLKKANARLKELDVLKDEFVSIASHELRTPMTAIKSYLWMAINKSPQKLSPQLKKYLDISYQSTERLIHLVNDMLTVSRIERNKIEIKQEFFDVSEILQLVHDELKISAEEKNITFTLTKAEGEKYPVKGDREKLREVFQNLVGNALKFTSSKGTIAIQCEKKAKTVVVSVSDTGSGIQKEDQSKLFKKFSKIDYSYSKHSNQPGTGFGLYISKQIVSLHHGDITVQSEVGEGSTFTVALPRAILKGGGKKKND